MAFPSLWKHCHFIVTMLLCITNTEIQNSHLVEGSTSEPTETGAVLAVGVVGTAWSCKGKKWKKVSVSWNVMNECTQIMTPWNNTVLAYSNNIFTKGVFWLTPSLFPYSFIRVLSLRNEAQKIKYVIVTLQLLHHVMIGWNVTAPFISVDEILLCRHTIEAVIFFSHFATIRSRRLNTSSTDKLWQQSGLEANDIRVFWRQGNLTCGW